MRFEIALRPTVSRLALGFCVALALTNCATAPKRPLPPVEPWGDLSRPYGDALDAAAREALGRRDPAYSVYYDAIWLEDFYTLDMVQRQARERRAHALRVRATTLRDMSGLDSLGLYLEALHTAPVDIKSYEHAGRILLNRGAWRRGHALLVQGIRLDPRNGVLWTLLGAAYLQVGNNSKARVALEYALLQGDREIKRVNVAENLATLYVQEGEYARADSLISETAGGIPAWLQSYVRAKEAWTQGDLRTAGRELREAARDSLAHSAVYVDLGALELQSDSLDAAEAAYRRALHLDPHQQSARNGLGLVQWARGDLDQAMLRFARLVRVNPHNYAAQLNYGGVLLDAADAHDNRDAADSLRALAVRHFGVCIDADYRRSSAYAGRAQAHLRRGEYDAALADARQLTGSPTHDEHARLLIARASLSSGNASEAIEQLEPLYEAGSLPQIGIAMLGKALLEQKQYDRAASVLRRAVEAGAPSLSVAMNYAVALSESGKLDEAEAVLRDLVDAHPNDASLLQNLAAVLQRQGRIAEADQLLIRVNRLEGR